jgi:hypothetical protein
VQIQIEVDEIKQTTRITTNRTPNEDNKKRRRRKQKKTEEKQKKTEENRRKTEGQNNVQSHVREQRL